MTVDLFKPLQASSNTVLPTPRFATTHLGRALNFRFFHLSRRTGRAARVNTHRGTVAHVCAFTIKQKTFKVGKK